MVGATLAVARDGKAVARIGRAVARDVSAVARDEIGPFFSLRSAHHLPHQRRQNEIRQAGTHA